MKLKKKTHSLKYNTKLNYEMTNKIQKRNLNKQNLDEQTLREYFKTQHDI